MNKEQAWREYSKDINFMMMDTFAADQIVLAFNAGWDKCYDLMIEQRARSLDE